MGGAQNAVMKLSFAALLWSTVTLLAVPSSLAQSGSSDRREFEKEENGPHGSCSTSWTRLGSGMEYRSIRCLGGDEIDVHVVRIDPSKVDLNTALVGATKGSSIEQRYDASFVLNANFFDKARRAEGLVVRSGDVASPLRQKSWQSVFLIREDGTPRIVPVSGWSSEAKRARLAVQAGPRTVVGGHTNRVHQSYSAARAGVCIQKDRKLIFFATPQSRKLDMYEIARITRRGEEDGGLRCHEAMLFDGGHSVNFRISTPEKEVSIEGDPVPVFIYGKAR